METSNVLSVGDHIFESLLGKLCIALGKRQSKYLEQDAPVTCIKTGDVEGLADYAARTSVPVGVVVSLAGSPSEAYSVLRDLQSAFTRLPQWRPLGLLISMEGSLERQHLVAGMLGELAQLCQSREVPLILNGADESIQMLACEVDQYLLEACKAALLEGVDSEPPLDSAELIRLVQTCAHLAIDHFSVTIHGRELHLPILAEIAALSELEGRPSLSGSIRHKLPATDDEFSKARLVPIDISGGGAAIWCAALVDDASKVASVSKVIPGDNVILVTDFYHDDFGLQDVCDELSSRGVIVRGVLACFEYAGQRPLLPEGVWLFSVAKLPKHLQVQPIDNCSYCRDDMPIVRSERGFSGYMNELGRPHPRAFWDMLRWSPEFVEVGHWRSTVTDNHFQFRILAHDVIQVFSNMIAVRLKNEICSVLMEGWIDCVASTDGPDRLLAQRLVQLLRLPPDRAWLVRRAELPPNAVASSISIYLIDHDQPSDYTAQNVVELSEQQVVGLGGTPNVIVVDQAAHHFYTFEGIQRAIEDVGGRPLTLSVLVDRYSLTEEEATPFYSTRYLPLYHWPADAMTSTSCGCTVVGAR